MRVRVFDKLNDETIGETGLKGRCLVKPGDSMYHVCYEIPVEDNCLLKAFKPKFNHVYYCIIGKINVRINQQVLEVEKDSVFALTADMIGHVQVLEPTRLFAIYAPEDDSIEQPTEALVRSLEEVEGSEHDINWGNGLSRRFLVKGHGFNIGIHKTWIYPETTSPLQYRNHWESCYYFEGQGAYTWGNNDNKKHEFDYEGETGGTVFIMDHHDKHYIRNGNKDSFCISVFSPPLNGDEAHKISKDGASFSSY